LKSTSSSISTFGNSAWKEAFDVSTRQIYYYNQLTLETSWTRPIEMGPVPTATGTFGRGAAGSSAQTDLEDRNTRWLQRPARKQADLDISRLQSHEGGNEFNIWYGKYSGDYTKGKGGLGRDPAPTRCDPENDAGWTKGSKRSESEKAYFCLHFAKGACSKGHECTFLHHIPTAIDDGTHEQMKDVFGRDRFQTHREDMTGVGAYSSDCRTLYVGGIKKKDEAESLLKRHFGIWGEIEQLNIISRLSIAFVRYRCRINAEIALIAMSNQSLGGGEVLNVRWAHDDPNPVAISSKLRADADAVEAAIASKNICPPILFDGNDHQHHHQQQQQQQIVDVVDNEEKDKESDKNVDDKINEKLNNKKRNLLQLVSGYADENEEMVEKKLATNNTQIDTESIQNTSRVVSSLSSSSGGFSGNDAMTFLSGQIFVSPPPPPPPLNRNSPEYSTWYYQHYLPWLTSAAAAKASSQVEEEKDQGLENRNIDEIEAEELVGSNTTQPPIVGNDTLVKKKENGKDVNEVVDIEGNATHANKKPRIQ
jgi:hypothetical protein